MTQAKRFDRYMEQCLYGPDGFYVTSGTAGRSRGDFITSPEVGPLFGAVLTAVIDSRWQAAGSPVPLKVYDVGCGPGRLLTSVAHAKGERGWELVGVDRVESPGASLQELPEDLSGAVVIANELLDNLPFRIIEHGEDGFFEVFVSEGRECLVPTDQELPIPVGTRAPYLEAANNWVTDTLSRNPAALILFDYGAVTTAELATRGGWLRTYRDHQRGSDPLNDPGLSDITTDIAWDQLPAPDALVRQSDFLRQWGLDDLVAEGRQYWRDHAHAPDLAAMRMRSRVSEAEALVDSDGLGNWWAATWTNGSMDSRLV